MPLQRLVPLLLNFRKGTNRDELEQFFETITDDPTSVTPVSEAAFCRARQKLKPEALVTLNNVLLDSANQQIAQQRWRGLRVLAVDGSTGRLPDFLAIEEYFGKPSGSGVPLARFSRLFDVLNDQILHADMVPYATGERELAAEYLLYSSPMTCSSMTGATRHSGCLPSMPRNSVITVRVYGMTSIPKSKPSWRMAPRSALWS